MRVGKELQHLLVGYEAVLPNRAHRDEMQEPNDNKSRPGHKNMASMICKDDPLEQGYQEEYVELTYITTRITEPQNAFGRLEILVLTPLDCHNGN